MPKQTSQAAAHPGQDTDRQERRDAIYAAGRYGPGSRLHQQTFYGAIEQSRRGEIRRAQTAGAACSRPTWIISSTTQCGKSVQGSDRRGRFQDGHGSRMSTSDLDEPSRSGVPIRKVRIFTPSVKHPIALKKQRDLYAERVARGTCHASHNEAGLRIARSCYTRARTTKGKAQADLRTRQQRWKRRSISKPSADQGGATRSRPADRTTKGFPLEVHSENGDHGAVSMKNSPGGAVRLHATRAGETAVQGDEIQCDRRQGRVRLMHSSDTIGRPVLRETLTSLYGAGTSEGRRGIPPHHRNLRLSVPNLNALRGRLSTSS